MSEANLHCFICRACGTQFPEAVTPPVICPICNDSRQFVPRGGQQWSTLEELSLSHRNIFRQQDDQLLGIGTEPDFAIGQRALLLRTKAGNFLWDCISLIDDATIRFVREQGGLAGIAISHPHYYTSMSEWSRAFDDAPIYLHARDRQWVMRPGQSVVYWEEDEKEIAPGVTLIRLGGHFPGGTVLHWQDGADGRGTILSGDILQVTPDGFVSFMYSYPNLIPLPPKTIREIQSRLDTWKYNRIHGAWWDRVILKDASQIFSKSVERYIRAVTELER
jgi:glyoxylase-like metal-dependent hydrolase (beta-lactamase superfamily II)